MFCPCFWGWFWPILYFLCETSTWHLDSCLPEDTWYGVILWVVRVLGQSLNQSARIFLHQSFLGVTPYWRAPIRAKQLSMATVPLCFEFFRCRVDECRVTCHVVRSALQSFACRSLNVSTCYFCWSSLYRSYVLRQIGLLSCAVLCG